MDVVKLKSLVQEGEGARGIPNNLFIESNSSQTWLWLRSYPYTGVQVAIEPPAYCQVQQTEQGIAHRELTEYAGFNPHTGNAKEYLQKYAHGPVYHEPGGPGFDKKCNPGLSIIEPINHRERQQIDHDHGCIAPPLYVENAFD